MLNPGRDMEQRDLFRNMQVLSFVNCPSIKGPHIRIAGIEAMASPITLHGDRQGSSEMASRLPFTGGIRDTYHHLRSGWPLEGTSHYQTTFQVPNIELTTNLLQQGLH